MLGDDYALLAQANKFEHLGEVEFPVTEKLAFQELLVPCLQIQLKLLTLLHGRCNIKHHPVVVRSTLIGLEAPVDV